jgi:hypothetical protein
LGGGTRPGQVVLAKWCYSKGMLACVIMVSRRRLAAILTTLIVLFSMLPSAGASVARAIRLADLVRSSQHVVVGIPGESWSRWETVGPSRRIVTYTRVRVEETVAAEASGAEILVRTFGGIVDDVGQVVYGEALLKRGERSLLFVRKNADGKLAVAGMAQGHFPLKVDAKGVFRVMASRHLDKLIGRKDSAVARLSGQSVVECQRLIAEAARQ